MAEDLSGAIRRGLKTDVVGRRIIYLPSVTSTMDAAREQAFKRAAEGTAVIAGEQTQGRGRLKRKWFTPAGNIALSIILYPSLASLPCLIMVASLAVVKAIKSVTGVEGQIKWPNDILIDGKKVSGILIENEVQGNKVVYSIVGIGINVGLSVNKHKEIADIATSLDDDIDRIKLIRSLLQEFDKLYQQLPDGKTIYKSWRANLVTLGKQVKATWGKQIIEGIAEDVDKDGALLIREKDGEIIKIVAGDVTLRG